MPPNAIRYIIAALLLLFIGCNRDRFDVDISDIRADIHLSRLDKALFSINPDELEKELPRIKTHYGTFFSIYCERLIRIGSPADSGLAVQLKRFITDPDVRMLYRDCDSSFSDMKFLLVDLSKAFRYYQYHFPGKVVPRVITYLSGINYALATGDSVLGIGLDMYLGSNYKMYAGLGLPRFKTVQMTRDYMAIHAVKGWVQANYISQGNDFITEMINLGKTHYALDALMPWKDPAMKIGYTPAQLEWCRKNEKQVWAYFIEQDLLFSGNYNKYMKYISEGPTTNGFPKDSPGMIGAWIGLQIIRSYMENNPGITLAQLMAEQNAKKILNESGYKPG